MAFIDKNFQRARLIFGIGIVLIYIAEIVTVVILGIAILRLVKSRAKACEQGQLNRKLLLFVFLLNLTQFVFVVMKDLDWGPYTAGTIISSACLLINSLILCYLYAYVLATCDLHEFVPKTILRSDNKIELIAVGLNGNQLFSFIIDE